MYNIKKQTQLYKLALLCLFLLSHNAHTKHTLLVNAEWLKQHITDSNIVVIDVRSKNEYLKNHIMAAINITVEDTFGGSAKPNRIGSPASIKALLSRNGVQNKNHVILYDNGNFKNAARFFWVLETYGHRHVSILNGGFNKWSRLSNPTTRITRKLERSNYIPVLKHQYLTTKFNTMIAINNTNVVILDARSNKEYIGENSSALRHGHIPSAINIPWHHNIDSNKNLSTLKSRKQLGKLYSNIARNFQIITYCNRGKQSAVTYFALRLLGYKVAVYDGAWLEWGNDPGLPIDD